MSYVRVSVLGTLSGGEVWSINPVFDPSGELEIGIDQSKVDAAAKAIADLAIPAALLTLMSSSAQRVGARVEVRSDASDSLLAISTQSSTTNAAGSAVITAPYQTSVVCSIRTDTPGGSGRGRLYWPALAASLAQNARVTNPTPATTAAAFKTYLSGMQSALATAFPLISFDLAVRSKTTHTTPHAVRLQVGDVLDTQRRRRDALPESYVQVTYP